MANIIRISDISSPELKIYTSLTEAQLKRDSSLFIAESVKVVKVAIQKKIKIVSFLMEERQIEGIGKELIQMCPDVPVYTASREVLSQITGFELTRGILCAAERPEPLSLEDVLKNAKRVAVLERLSDSVNVGSIFRSAAALGFDAVLLFHNCPDPLNRRCVRVSMGTVFQIPWAFFDKENFETADCAVKFLKEKGFITGAMALKGDSISLDSEKLKTADKLALFFGAEGDGLSPETIENCDYTVKIPMRNSVDSLNVATAAAIAFWQLSEK